MRTKETKAAAGTLNVGHFGFKGFLDLGFGALKLGLYVKPSGSKDNRVVPGNAFPKLDVRRRLLAGIEFIKSRGALSLLSMRQAERAQHPS